MPRLRQALKILGWFVGGFILLVIALYIEEDWRGSRDWAVYQKELQARGESLDLRVLAPYSDSKNDLSKVPIFAELYQQRIGNQNSRGPINPPPVRFDRVNVNLGSTKWEIPKHGGFKNSRPYDLAAWQSYYRSLPEAHLSEAQATPAQSILAALGQTEPEIREIGTAMQTPNAFWPIDYQEPQDSKFGGIVGMLKVVTCLTLRDTAHLENKESDLAEKDMLLTFDINRALSRNCLLVNYLVIVAGRTIADQILWEGIHRHAWNKTQLQEMERALASEDMLSLAVRALRTERAEFLVLMDLMQKRDARWVQGALGSWSWSCLVSLRPEGWWDEDRKSYCLSHQEIIDRIKPSEGTLTKRIEPQENDSEVRAFFQMIVTPFTYLSRPGFNHMDQVIAEAAGTQRLARLACRLEDYYLNHHSYPEKLTELADLPADLNQEVLTGRSLNYQRRGGSYFLYSTGWDGTDHGGKGRQSGQSDRDYDWVWPGP